MNDVRDESIRNHDTRTCEVSNQNPVFSSLHGFTSSRDRANSEPKYFHGMRPEGNLKSMYANGGYQHSNHNAHLKTKYQYVR